MPIDEAKAYIQDVESENTRMAREIRSLRAHADALAGALEKNASIVADIEPKSDFDDVAIAIHDADIALTAYRNREE